MRRTGIDRTVAAAVLVLAALNAVWALSLPPAAHPPSRALVVIWTLLLVVHALLYAWSERLARTIAHAGITLAQAAVVLAIGLSGRLYPLGVLTLAVLMTYTILTMAGRWPAWWIIGGAALLFVIATTATSTSYRAASTGMLLTGVGLVAYLVHRVSEARAVTAAGADVHIEKPLQESLPQLTDRERQVFDMVIDGQRTSYIANALGITERTVKAHLTSIYQKLGVESRAAAMARWSSARGAR
jgi:DNA-binding CsgD family transcriptional regulator